MKCLSYISSLKGKCHFVFYGILPLFDSKVDRWENGIRMWCRPNLNIHLWEHCDSYVSPSPALLLLPKEKCLLFFFFWMNCDIVFCVKSIVETIINLHCDIVFIAIKLNKYPDSVIILGFQYLNYLFMLIELKIH